MSAIINQDVFGRSLCYFGAKDDLWPLVIFGEEVDTYIFVDLHYDDMLAAAELIKKDAESAIFAESLTVTSIGQPFGLSERDYTLPHLDDLVAIWGDRVKRNRLCRNPIEGISMQLQHQFGKELTLYLVRANAVYLYLMLS